MKNKDVIKAFLNKQRANTLNLRTKESDGKFILENYDTPLAYIINNDLWINQCKYSSSTSTIQGQLNYQASLTDYNIMYYNQNKKDKKGSR